nr:hypothetical protein HK105_004537 [Polyrhizophydium stewartii]
MASTPSAYYYAATVAATGDCKTLAVTTGAVFHVFETCTAANSSAWIKTTLTPDGQATLSNALCPTSGCTSGCVTLSTHVKPAPRGDLSCVSRAGSQNVYTAATAIAATSVFSGTGGSWSPSANSTSSKDKAKEADVPVPVSTNSSGLLTTLSPLAIAGIAVGGVIFLGLCAGLVLVVTRRTNKSSGADSQQRQTFLPKPVTSTTAAP